MSKALVAYSIATDESTDVTGVAIWGVNEDFQIV